MKKINVVTAYRHSDGIARIAELKPERIGEMPTDQVTTEIKIFSYISHDDIGEEEYTEFVNLCMSWIKHGWASERFEVNTGEMQMQIDDGLEYLKALVRVVPTNPQCKTFESTWTEMHWIFMYVTDRPTIGFKYGNGEHIMPLDMFSVNMSGQQVQALQAFVQESIETGDALEFEQLIKNELSRDGITRFTVDRLKQFLEFLSECGGFTVHADADVYEQAPKVMLRG